MADSKLLQLSPEALFRYQVVSAVQVRVLGGIRRTEAVREVLQQPHPDLRGELRALTERTLYRWLNAYEADGLSGLEPQLRPRIATSAILPVRLLGFLRQEKHQDPEVSVPELIERARQSGILSEQEPISRISVWRACRRMGLPLKRVQKLRDQDMRRFAYPNRMLMVLCDGKHFRAGVHRLRRLALHFLDDATRYGLGVLVGTSETAELFLQGLHQTVSRYGLMSALFLDRGPGFIADDTYQLTARLGIKLIHGTASYPEGHGKIERFHWTLIQRLLRGLDRNPEVDPSPSALTLRLSHWLTHIYNHTPHESLDGKTPFDRWHSDLRELRFPQDSSWLDAQFLLSLDRRVSNDNVIPYNGLDYELPTGYAGKRVRFSRNLLDGSLFIIHQGKKLTLHPVDLTQNAYARRARKTSTPPSAPASAPHTAAARAFEATFSPLVDDEGNFPKGKDDDDGYLD